MKVCTKCGKKKPLSEFYFKSSGRGGLRGECKTCHKRAMKKYNKKNYRLFHERGIARRYGLSLEQYLNLIEEHDNRCAICGNECKDSRPCVDHDHKTGKVRGILCPLCNRGLGHFQDSIELLTAAAEYLYGSRF